jgi:hypothetical protein
MKRNLLTPGKTSDAAPFVVRSSARQKAGEFPQNRDARSTVCLKCTLNVPKTCPGCSVPYTTLLRLFRRLALWVRQICEESGYPNRALAG